MRLVKEDLSKSPLTLNKIHFKSSVVELLEGQKTQTIKSILNLVDVIVEDDRDKAKLRKTILDNVNDMHRVTVNILDSLLPKQ